MAWQKPVAIAELASGHRFFADGHGFLPTATDFWPNLPMATVFLPMATVSLPTATGLWFEGGMGENKKHEVNKIEFFSLAARALYEGGVGGNKNKRLTNN